MIGFGCVNRVMYRDTEEISKQEVKKQLRALKNEKTAGLDEVTGEMMKIRETGYVTGCVDCLINH